MTAFLRSLPSRSWNAKRQILFSCNLVLWFNFLSRFSSLRILKLITCSQYSLSPRFFHVCKHEIKQTKPLLSPPAPLTGNYHQTTMEISWAGCALICCLFSRYHGSSRPHENLKTLWTGSFFQSSEDIIYLKFATCKTNFVLCIRLQISFHLHLQYNFIFILLALSFNNIKKKFSLFRKK